MRVLALTVCVLAHGFEPAFAQPQQTANDYSSAGMDLLQSKRFEEAIEPFQQALQLEPGNPYLAMALGQALLGSGKPRPAITHLETALRVLSQDAALRYTLAEAYQRVDDDKNALRVLSGTTPSTALTAPWLFLQGFSLFRLGRLPEAAKIFEGLLHYDGMRAPAKFFLANCAYSENRLAEALPLYAEAIRLGNVPGNKALNAYFYNYGLALYRLERYAEAADSFRQSLERYSRDPLPALFLARCDAAQGHYQEAIDIDEQVVKEHPEFSAAVYQLARLHAQHGDPNRAKELFRKVAELKRGELRQTDELTTRLMLGH
jgi:tetratricopeptide (TPR) repeat protein